VSPGENRHHPRKIGYNVRGFGKKRKKHLSTDRLTLHVGDRSILKSAKRDHEPAIKVLSGVEGSTNARGNLRERGNGPHMSESIIIRGRPRNLTGQLQRGTARGGRQGTLFEQTRERPQGGVCKQKHAPPDVRSLVGKQNESVGGHYTG